MRSRFLIAFSFLAAALLIVLAGRHVSAQAPADPKSMNDVLRSGGAPAGAPAPPAQAAPPPAAPPPQHAKDDIAEPFPGPANPLDLEASGDEAKRVVARIGPAGGVLRATGADGASYELTIPAKALREEIEIAMTPIAAVKGLPEELAEGQGVILEPDGLILDEIGLLRVSRPGMQASMDSIALIGEKRGYDSHMTLFRAEPGAMVVAVAHFTIFRTSADDLVKSTVRPARRQRVEQIVPRTTDRRFVHLVAVHLSRDHDRLSRAIDAYRAWFARGQLRSSNPDLACPALRQGYRSYGDAVRAARKLGYGPSSYPDAPDVPPEQAEYLIDQCRREAENFCRANMDGTRINEQVHAENRAGGGGPEATVAAVNWANEALKRCLPNEVVIRTVTDGTHTDKAGCKQPVRLDVEIRIRLGLSSFSTLRIPKLEGQGAHVIHAYEHSINTCGRADRIKNQTAHSQQPATALLSLYGAPGARRPMLELDPGIILMNWTGCAYGGCINVLDPEWWRDSILAHYQSRVDGGRIRFEFAVEGGSASDTFQGAGTWSSMGTWRGTERTVIRFERGQ